MNIPLIILFIFLVLYLWGIEKRIKSLEQKTHYLKDKKDIEIDNIKRFGL